MQNKAKFWDDAAEKYAQSPIADMDSYNATLDRTRSYLTKTDRVLELGCGTGSTALLLAPHVSHITASDISSNMLEIAREKVQVDGISNTEFITADLFDEKLETTPYDSVLALNLLHLVNDLPAALHRINMLLKPGGTFISKTFCPSGERMTFKLSLMKMALPLAQMLGKAPYVNFMGISDLENAIISAGFKIVETGNYPASSPTRYIVAQKI